MPATCICLHLCFDFKYNRALNVKSVIFMKRGFLFICEPNVKKIIKMQFLPLLPKACQWSIQLVWNHVKNDSESEKSEKHFIPFLFDLCLLFLQSMFKLLNASKILLQHLTSKTISLSPEAELRLDLLIGLTFIGRRPL